MKFRILGLFAALLFLHGCDLGSSPTGGGTEGNGLSGILVDGRGTPIANAKVRVYPDIVVLAKRSAALVAKADSTTTNADGSFKFANLPDGRYNLEASITRHDTVFSVFIRSIDFVKKLDLGLDTLRASGSVKLKILDSAGTPVVGANCSIPGSSWKAVSNDGGECVVLGVAPGVYPVTVTVNGVTTTTDPVLAVSGQTANAGTITFIKTGEANTIPGNWVLTSLQGYAYYLPPEMALQFEGYGDDSWDARYSSASITLQMGSGMVGPLDRPDSFPEYSEESFRMDTVTSGGFVYDALLLSYRIPEAMSPLYGSGYIAGLQIYASSPVVFEVGGMMFRALCATREDQAIAMRILRSVRKWKGPQAAPYPAPFKPTLLSPRLKDSVSAFKSANQVVWRAALGATMTTSYRLQVSLSPSFTTLVQDDSVSFNRNYPGPDSVIHFFQMASGSGLTYYWRVLAVGPGGSTASETRSLYMVPTPPSAPLAREVASPAVNDTGVSRTPVVSWGVIVDAATYEKYFRVQISIDSLFLDPVINDSVSDPFLDSRYSWRVSGVLAPSTKYYVRVVAIGPGGSTSSAIRAFTTGTESYDPPLIPQLSSPSANGTVTQSSSTFSWMSANRGSTTTSYYLQVASDSLFKNLSVYDSVDPGNAETGLTTWVLKFSVLTSGRSYFWRVVGVGPGGFTASESRKLIVQ